MPIANSALPNRIHIIQKLDKVGAQGLKKYFRRYPAQIGVKAWP